MSELNATSFEQADKRGRGIRVSTSFSASEVTWLEAMTKALVGKEWHRVKELSGDTVAIVMTQRAIGLRQSLEREIGRRERKDTAVLEVVGE